MLLFQVWDFKTLNNNQQTSLDFLSAFSSFGVINAEVSNLLWTVERMEGKSKIKLYTVYIYIEYTVWGSDELSELIFSIFSDD